MAPPSSFLLGALNGEQIHVRRRSKPFLPGVLEMQGGWLWVKLDESGRHAELPQKAFGQWEIDADPAAGRA